MKVIFKSKSTGACLSVTGVQALTTNSTVFSVTGYGIEYDDGTVSVYAYDEWDLMELWQ